MRGCVGLMVLEVKRKEAAVFVMWTRAKRGHQLSILIFHFNFMNPSVEGASLRTCNISSSLSCPRGSSITCAGDVRINLNPQDVGLFL